MSRSRRTTTRRTSRRTSEEPRKERDQRERKKYFDDNSPPKRAQSVDSKTVGLAGIAMFLMTNFKKEIGQILVAISKIIGGS